MPALLILNYDVHDAERLGRYRTTAAPVLLGPGRGRLLGSTSTTQHLAEAPPGGTHTVVLEFEDVATASATYESAAYHSARTERLGATRPVVAMIVPTSIRADA